jgi:Tfp pilus assembly protein PilN
MTRVNLLRIQSERSATAAPRVADRRAAMAGGLLLTLTSCGLGLWAAALHREATRLDLELTAARQTMSRLQVILGRADAMRLATQNLQQRVEQLEQLRAAQRAPVHMLEEIGRSLPDDCWLTAITDDPPDAVRIEGRASALPALFAFVERLEASGGFRGGVEVLESHVDAADVEDGSATFSLKVFGRRARAPLASSTARRAAPAVAGIR